MRLKMLSNINMGATLSTLREGREQLSDANQTYLVHREKANKIVGRPDPNPYSMTVHPKNQFVIESGTGSFAGKYNATTSKLKCNINELKKSFEGSLIASSQAPKIQDRRSRSIIHDAHAFHTVRESL